MIEKLGYEIKENGDIISKRLQKPLSWKINQDGYAQVTAHDNGLRKSYYVHRLVAFKYLKNPKNHTQVNHKDENKLNNNASNLEWCSQEYNIRYSSKHKDKINQIKKLIKNGFRNVDISKETGVCQQVISDIRRGKKWK